MLTMGSWDRNLLILCSEKLYFTLNFYDPYDAPQRVTALSSLRKNPKNFAPLVEISTGAALRRPKRISRETLTSSSSSAPRQRLKKTSFSADEKTFESIRMRSSENGRRMVHTQSYQKHQHQFKHTRLAVHHLSTKQIEIARQEHFYMLSRCHEWHSQNNKCTEFTSKWGEEEPPDISRSTARCASQRSIPLVTATPASTLFLSRFPFSWISRSSLMCCRCWSTTPWTPPRIYCLASTSPQMVTDLSDWEGEW